MMQEPHEHTCSGKPVSSPEGRILSARLYQRYAANLLAYLCRHVPVMHDAEDILFEVFLAALEHEADLVELAEDQQRAWLWTVARNRLIDAYRRKKRRPDVPLESITEMIDQAHTPEQAALRGEEDEQVRRWIRTLPPQQQEVLTMRFTGEMRCAEIAAILQKNEGAVRTMLSRALNALRGLYHEEQRGAEQ